MDPIEFLESCKKNVFSDVSDITLAQNIDYVSLWRHEKKKVRKYIDDILCGENPDEGLEFLMNAGVLSSLIPELKAIHTLGDGEGTHKNVWEHSKIVVSGVPPVLELRWGALFHDIGKSTTRRYQNGKVTFHNHDFVGARMVENIQNRLGIFSDDASLFQTVKMLVQYHLRPTGYKPSWNDAAIRRFVLDCDETGDPEFFKKLMLLSRADLTTKVTAKRIRAAKTADTLERHVQKVIDEDNAPKFKLPKGTMGEILLLSGKKPGAWANELREKLERNMKEGILLSNESVSYYVEQGLQILAT